MYIMTVVLIHFDVYIVVVDYSDCGEILNGYFVAKATMTLAALEKY